MLSGQPGGPRMYPRSGYFLVLIKELLLHIFVISIVHNSVFFQKLINVLV